MKLFHRGPRCRWCDRLLEPGTEIARQRSCGEWREAHRVEYGSRTDAPMLTQAEADALDDQVKAIRTG